MSKEDIKKKPIEGDLRIWWIPQVPGKSFYVSVTSLKEAKLILNTLADYDMFQFKNRIKGDYANTGGLMIFQDGEWVDWINDDFCSIDEVDDNGKTKT